MGVEPSVMDLMHQTLVVVHFTEYPDAYGMPPPELPTASAEKAMAAVARALAHKPLNPPEPALGEETRMRAAVAWEPARRKLAAGILPTMSVYAAECLKWCLTHAYLDGGEQDGEMLRAWLNLDLAVRSDPFGARLYAAAERRESGGERVGGDDDDDDDIL